MSSKISRYAYRRVVHRQGGFSFLEVMVVVLIIGLLAGAVTIKVGDYIDNARTNRAKSDIGTIVNALETYAMNNNGKFPSNDQGLSVLSIQTTKDPWGNHYQYSHPGRSQEAEYEVISYGRDGREGGEGIDADISNITLMEEGRE